MKSVDNTPQSQNNAATRLAALLETTKFIPFEIDIADKEYAYIKLSIYGAIETNELFVKLTNGKAVFVDVVESPLDYPRMGDRIFGMDASDAQVSFALATRLWEANKNTLIQR